MTDPFARGPAAATAPAAPVQAQPYNPGAPNPQPSPYQMPRDAAGTATPFPSAGAPDPFGGPAPRGDRPKMRDLYGRLVLIMPKKLEAGVATKWRDPVTQEVKRQDRLTMDIVVLDGGPLAYGGDPTAVPPVPHNKSAEVPVRFDGMYDSHTGIISQTRDALANFQRQAAGQQLRPGETTMVLGRVTVGEKSGENKAPFILEPANEQDIARARAWVQANHRDPFGNA